MTKPKPKNERQRAVERGFRLAPSVRSDRGDVDLLSVVTPGIGTIKRDVVRSRLYRHHQRREITTRQYRAGIRFAETAERSTVPLRSQLNTDRLDVVGDPAQSRVGWRRAKASIETAAAIIEVGPILSPVVMWVVIEGRPAGEWAEHVGRPATHGIAALCLGLDALARHYGLDNPVGAEYEDRLNR